MSEKEKILTELERLEKKNNCGTAEFIEAKRIAYGEVRKAVNSLKGKTRAELFDEYLKASPSGRRKLNMDFLGGPVERLMRSTEKLHDDIDDCISQIVKSRLDKDKEAEGRAMFRMESLMVGTQQQLGCILDLFEEKPKKKTNALFEKCVAAVDPEIKQKVSDAVDKSNWESDLKKEIDRFWEKDFDGNCANYFEAVKQTARHFAEWQKESKIGPTVQEFLYGKQPEVDLDAEIDKFLYGTKFKRDYDGVHVPGVCMRDWKGKKYVNRDVTPNDMRNFARHFYGLRNRALEEAARHVYESWMGGTMDDVRRDMVELGNVLNARKEE